VITHPEYILEGHGPHFCRFCKLPEQQTLTTMVIHMQNVHDLMVIERSQENGVHVVKMDRPNIQRLGDEDDSAMYRISFPGHFFKIKITLTAKTVARWPIEEQIIKWFYDKPLPQNGELVAIQVS
jgi:hypothetical protein